MDITFGDVQSVIGKPLSGKGRLIGIIILFFLIIILLLVFLIVTGYIKLINPAAPKSTNAGTNA